MEEKKKNYFPLIAIITIIIVIIGATIAYFTSSDTFTNIFNAGSYSTEVREVFESPSNWAPGTTTPKVVTVKNTGNVCEHARVSFTENWQDDGGNTIPLSQNGNQAAIINFSNKADWIKIGNYYYYYDDITNGEETNSFIESVTFNPEISNTYTCTGSGLTHNCSSTQTGYDNGHYTLVITVETVQCDAADDVWGVDYVSLNGTATFDSGQNVNAKIKSLAAGSSKAYTDQDNFITSFERSGVLPNNFVASSDNTISSSSSTYPIYAWYDNGTIYYYSVAGTIKLNAVSTYFMSNCRALTNISGFERVNASAATSISNFFNNCITLSDISPLSDWTFGNSSLTMVSVFNGCSSITNLQPLSSWNTSRVASKSEMFSGCTGITNLNPLASWDVSKDVNMSNMFSGCTGLANIDVLSNWTLNTTSAVRLSYMFYNCNHITSFGALSGWNVSKVEYMNAMFQNCTGLTSLDIFSSWTTSSLKDTSYMFAGCTGLVNLSGLGNLDTADVTNMQDMFSGCSNLTDASAINGWDVSSVIYTANTSSGNKFYFMFQGCSVHPTFTGRAGTWDNNGSFVPTT